MSGYESGDYFQDMENLGSQEMQQSMTKTLNIRNVSIIGQIGNGKTSLAETLLNKAGMSVESTIGKRESDTRKGKGNTDFTTKSTAISMYFKHNNQNIALIAEDNYDKADDEDGLMVHLMDNPGHVSFASEVMTALRITDGALVVVDCLSGVCTQTKSAIRQCIRERVKPILFLNKMDQVLLDKDLEPEELYQTFRRIIRNVNATITLYGDMDDPMGDLRLDPCEGSVGFGSALQGWAFTVKEFAEFYSSMFDVPVKTLMEKLWGPNFYSRKTKKWSKKKTDDNDRAFNVYILDPIFELVDAIINFKTEESKRLLDVMKIKLKPKDYDIVGKDLLKLVMHAWLPAGNALLHMMTIHLPSPVNAQRYRTEILYKGPSYDKCYTAMRNCDVEGPLMVYIAKMVPSCDKGRFYALGRVFSGQVASGQQVRILGPQYVPGEDKDLYVEDIQRSVLMMGKSVKAIEHAFAGNICGFVGIDQYLVNSGTITTSRDAHNIKAMKFSVSPVVQVAVEPSNPSDLPILVEGLKRLSKIDGGVKLDIEESGEQIIAGTSEIHLETCLKELEEDHACIPLKKLDIFASYRESVREESMICRYTHPSSYNPISMKASPLPEWLPEDIEDGEVTSLIESHTASDYLCNMYEFDATESRNIWAFGPESYNANLFVDTTKGVQSLDVAKEPFILGFQRLTRFGPLCAEPLRGVRFDLKDVSMNQDPHTRHNLREQLICCISKTMEATFLAAKPCIQEPVFLCEVHCPEDVIGCVYGVLGKRNGDIINEKFIASTQTHVIKSYIPVSDSFGLTNDLQECTGGEAFSQCNFDHWQVMPGDPMQAGATSLDHPYNVVCNTRRRKGLSLELPKLPPKLIQY